MKYYELHEEFWKRLSENGHISWDKENKTELMSKARNQDLSEFLDIESGSVLDLGSGSGSQSFYLANLGFNCTAVDISETAIKTGKELAHELGFHIDFLCEDICHLNIDKKFDVVTDSSLLHCLVFNEERGRFFQVAKNHMNPNGRLFIHTMVRDTDQMLFEDNDYFHLDHDGVLWSKGPESFEVDWTEINGENYFPHRRIYSTQQQRNEIIHNGFEITKEKVYKPPGNEHSIYVAWLK